MRLALAVIVALALPFIAAADNPAPAATVAPYSKVGEYKGVHEYTLANGMQVLIAPDHRAPVVTFNVTFKVGSRMEKPGATGATHLLEHMMFKGTPNHNKAKGNAYDQILRRIGAEYNATTWLDRTNYFATFGKEHLATIMELEADRMSHAWIRESDRKSEMTVVRNEMERGENSPNVQLDEAVNAAVFTHHAYGHSTIGFKDDVETVPIRDLQAFFKTYYRANNAVAVVVGDVDPDKEIEKIAAVFASLPKSKKIPTRFSQEPPQKGERRVIVKHPAPLGLIQIAYRAVSARDPDAPALLVLDAILSGAWGSKVSTRLYQKLVEAGLARSAVSNPDLYYDPGTFSFHVELMPGVEHAKAEQALYEEIERIKNEPVGADELKKAQNQLEVADIYGREGSMKFTWRLNEAIAQGDWKLAVDRVEQIKKVTIADVQRVARKYLLEDTRTVGWLVPKSEGAATVGGK